MHMLSEKSLKINIINTNNPNKNITKKYKEEKKKKIGYPATSCVKRKSNRKH